MLTGSLFSRIFRTTQSLIRVKENMIPRQLKVNASLTFVLAAVFYLFWQISKQQPSLLQVNAFAVDPYDAVGSFSTQLALFTATLSVIRAFRPYQPSSAIATQILYLVRAEYITCLSVAITLVTDIIALLRHPSVWMDIPAGHLLVALVGGMALLTALVGWRIHNATLMIRLPSAQHSWSRAIGISVAGMIILVLYPENVTNSITGAVLTVLVGMALFFASVWVWAMAITPSLEAPDEDLIDDLAVLYRWLKSNMDRSSIFFTTCEQILGSSFLRPIVNWLNPRKHAWNGILLFGMLIGLALALAEAVGEGGLGSNQPHRFVAVATLFIGLEASGVLVGYAFLAKPLGLFRQDTDDKRSDEHSIQKG
jgi:hypothetical protein